MSRFHGYVVYRRDEIALFEEFVQSGSAVDDADGARFHLRADAWEAIPSRKPAKSPIDGCQG